MDTLLSGNDSALSANGRFGRLSYLGWNMLLGIVLFFIGIIAAIILPSFVRSSHALSAYLLFGLFAVLYLGAIYFSFIFTIRRLHDRNHTGWLSLLILLPLLNFIFFIYLSCAKGDEARNHYGTPRLTQGWEKVLAWIYIILVPISILILAATAIPAYQSYIERSQQMQLEQQQRYSE